jgi:hypothetical protein
MADTFRDDPRAASPPEVSDPPPASLAPSRQVRPGWLYVAALLALDGAVTGWIWPTLTRPLWYDESWRAYQLSIGSGWFEALKTANAPLPLGWYGLERALIAAFGNTAFVLRIPEIVALPATTLITYALARWWLGRPASAAVAAALTVNGSLLAYGMQLKQYLPEAASAAAVVLLWLRARRAAEHARSPLPAQLGLAVCAVTALSGLLLLAPLLLIDLGAAVAEAAPARWRTGRGSRHGAGLRPPGGTRWWRTPAAARLPGAIAVGAVAVAHLVFFVLPQSYLTKTPYWAGFFLDRSDWWSRLRTSGADLATRSVTAALLRPDGQPGSPFNGSSLLSGPAGWIVVTLTLALLACWLAGIAGALRTRDGQALVAAIVGAVALVIVGGFLRHWPAGWVRANLFLLPPLYVLAGVGARTLVQGAGRVRPLVGRAVSVAGRAAVLAPVLLAVIVGAGRVGELRATAHDPLLLAAMDKLVAAEKAQARPGDVQLVLPGRADLTQWYRPQRYYASYAAETRGGTAVPDSDTLLLGPGRFEDPVTAFLARRPRAAALFLVAYNLVPGQELRALPRFLRGQGWCAASRPSRWPLTGQLDRFTRCAG